MSVNQKRGKTGFNRSRAEIRARKFRKIVLKKIKKKASGKLAKKLTETGKMSEYLEKQAKMLKKLAKNVEIKKKVSK